MDIKRRNFVKGCVAASVLLVPGIASAKIVAKATGTPASGVDLHIVKSIKASFGGGFSVVAHSQSNGLTYADIEHYGNRYEVASADLLDWDILKSSFNNPAFAPSAVS